jgi:hypothetical protein
MEGIRFFFWILFMCPIYETSVETEEGLVHSVRRCLQEARDVVRRCSKTWRIAAMPEIMSVATTSKTCCELVENCIVKNNMGARGGAVG